MLTGTVATALLFAGRDGGTYSYVIGAIFGFSTLGMLFSSAGSGAPKKKEHVLPGHSASLVHSTFDALAQRRLLIDVVLATGPLTAQIPHVPSV